MTDNGERCSNCGTENPEGADFCVKCHQPLTGSAEEGIRENLDAQGNDSLFGAGGAAAGGTGPGLGAMGGGMMMPSDSPGGATMPDEGLPPRRS
jgi:hypothetical protein